MMRSLRAIAPVIFVGALSAAVGSSARALELRVGGGALSPSESTVVRSLLSDLDQALPEAIKGSFGRQTIDVEIVRLADSVAGMAHDGRVTLNRKIIERLAASSTPRQLLADAEGRMAHHHRFLYDLALASLIHELGHLYDRLDLQSEEARSLRARCQAAPIPGDTWSYARDPKTCSAALANTRTVSTQPDYLDAAYFRLPEAGGANFERLNFLETRSPDHDEWQSPSESFAVNLEYFLLDPEFKCRRPEMYALLLRRLGGPVPFARVNCRSSNALLVIDTEQGVSQARFEEANAERIFGVHYLHAGPGEDMTSRFGHSMLRLIVCAPKRSVVGPECLEDVAYHRVISFRANVFDSKLDYGKAMNGGYDSSAFILPLLTVLKEYTKGELRDLKSYPLRLHRAEVRSLVDATVSAQWSYRGKYRYRSNNCSHETWALLKRAWPQRAELRSLEILTPGSLEDALIKIGLADSSVFVDRTNAVAKGYLFPSKRANYERAVAELLSQGYLANALSPEAYVAQEPLTRRALTTRLASPGEAGALRRARAAFLLLEDFALLQARVLLMKSAMETLVDLQAKTNAEAGAEPDLRRKSARSILNGAELTRFFGNPSNLLAPGTSYGVPTEEDFSRISSNQAVLDAMNRSTGANVDPDADYRALSRREVLRRFDQTAENLNLLRQTKL